MSTNIEPGVDGAGATAKLPSIRGTCLYVDVMKDEIRSCLSGITEAAGPYKNICYHNILSCA